MARASRRLWNPLNGCSGVWRYGDMAKRWQRAAAAEQRVCGDLGCFAQVVKPSKWMEWSMAIWRHGQALATGCRCRATCSRWLGKAVAKAGVWWTMQAEVLAGQSRTPAVIPGAAPPGPRLGRGRRIWHVQPVSLKVILFHSLKTYSFPEISQISTDLGSQISRFPNEFSTD